MTHFTTALMFLLGLVGCSTVRQIPPDYSKIISDDYLTADSLSIKITYTHIPSCIEQYRSHMVIGHAYGTSKVYHWPYDGELEKLETISGSIMEEIRRFEVEGKDDKVTCGGIQGGNGILVSLYINQDSTKFGYCRDTWDGIGELMTSLRKRN